MKVMPAAEFDLDLSLVRYDCEIAGSTVALWKRAQGLGKQDTNTLSRASQYPCDSKAGLCAATFPFLLSRHWFFVSVTDALHTNGHYTAGTVVVAELRFVLTKKDIALDLALRIAVAPRLGIQGRLHDLLGQLQTWSWENAALICDMGGNLKRPATSYALHNRFDVQSLV